MNWLYIFLGFALLIMLHEAGHYVAAKATGMRVERFFLFFGPTIWSFKRGETEYGVKAIPLGGYVKITGMNPEEELPPEIAHRAYYRQKVWKRIVVIAAGPAVNIVLAFLIFAGVYLTSAQQATPEVERVLAKSPAAGALHKGDRIVAVDGSRYLNLKQGERIEGFRREIGGHECVAGRKKDGCLAVTPVRLTVVRDGQARAIVVRPRYDAAAGQTVVGFNFGSEPMQVSAGEAISRAGDSVWLITSKTGEIFARIFETEQRKQISGIVGTSDVANQTIDVGLTQSLLLLAVVSLSLGLINLLPILPLDGGHIFWAVVEKLRGRPASLRVMERASMVGFALVIMLFFIGLSNDIGRLNGDGFKVR
jgi:regulator of sigma E protease